MSDEIVMEGKAIDAAAYFDSLPERMAKRTKAGYTHPWRAPGQAPLSEPRQEVRERDAVPSHANPISKAGRGRK